MEQEELEELYYGSVTSYEKWEKTSKLLQKVANSITEDDCLPIAMMLYSYAIENILKAIIIIKKPEDIKRSLRKKSLTLPHILKGHNLDTLVKEATINKNDIKKIDPKISSQHPSLLFRLGRYAIWQARYPVPLNSPDMFMKFDNSNNDVMEYYTNEDRPRAKMILEYLHKELDKIKKLPRTIEINARYCQCYNNIEKPIDCSYFVNKKCHGVNSNDYIRYLEKK